MDDLGEDLSLQLPPSMQVPVTHEKPSSTMDSLVQIKNEFSAKVQDAIAKGDSSKKRRYERQLKQFEDAIKATKEGKTFNYAELIVPPGFAAIPLNNGRPVGGGGSSGGAAPKVSPPRSSASASLAPPSVAVVAPKSPTRAPSASKQQKIQDDDDDEEFDENKLLQGDNDDDDDILAQLEREVGDEDDDNDVDIGGLDLEDDYLNQQLKAVSNVLPKMPKNKAPGAGADGLDDEMGMHADLFNMTANRGSKLPNVKPQSTAQQQPKKQIGPLPGINPRPQQQQPQPVATKRPAVTTSNNKELAVILERQRLFKEAALKAKQEGNTSVALVYLRHAKGFEQMIIAAENGLPLDMTNLPVPPQLASRVQAGAQGGGKLQPPASSTRASLSPVKIEHKLIPGDRAAVFKQLEEELIEQVNVATANYKQFRDMGDVNNSKKLYQIAEESIKDLSALRTAKAHNEQVPLYHYEKRSYQTIDCNSDLTDNDLELTIMRAVNLPLPKDFEPKQLTTYVKYEFPFPQEAVQTDKTNKQSGTLNPEYNQTFRVQIQRKQAKFVRLMNRKDLKLEIYYKAGLLKGDKLLATCLVKLQQLENTATIHDAFDCLEGRRQIGGKLELRIRIREPLLHQEVRETEHKWLIIDKFVKSNSPGKKDAEEKVSL